MERERSYELWGVAAAVLLGLSLRLVPARNALAGGEVQFYGYDSFYHMRRALYTAENFPSALWFDSYLNHPIGFELTWPPLFDQIVAAAALLLGGSPRAVEAAGAIIPPILGSLMILLLYLLARKLFGTKVALLAALLLAIDPKHIARTIFGLPDHDPMELLLMLGAILLLASALTDRDRRLWFGAAAGALLAAVGYTWLGAPIYMIGILIYAAVQISLDLREGADPGDAIAPMAAAFGVALLLFLPFWDEPWLLPSFVGALGSLVALGILYPLSRLFVAKRVPWQAFGPLVATLGYILLIFSYATEIGRYLHSLFREGLAYFFDSELSRVGVEEAMPIFRVYDLASLSILGLIFSLGGLFILARGVRPSTGLRPDRLLFLIWAGLAAALAISQTRFLFLFSVSGSVLVSLLFFWGMEKIWSSDLSQRADPRVVRVAVALLLLALLIPAVVSLPAVVRYKPEIAGDWTDSLDWVGENAPPTEGFELPVEAGNYSILSWWDYGNWILYRSKRPVVANNFQAGATDSARFFLAEEEEEALNVADRRGVRYVITDEKMVYRKLPAIARWIDEDPASYVSIAADSEVLTYEHSPRFLATVLARLHLRDCSDLGSFRLVYESKTTSGLRFPVSRVKVFERVKGARIAGTTPYDEPMGVILDMTSNQGRRFQYFSSTTPVDGRYEIVVPYSTGGTDGTHSVGPYLLGPLKDFPGGDATEVEVSEEDVLGGGTVEVNF